MDSAGEELADRLRAMLVFVSGSGSGSGSGSEVEERRMFGTRAFLLNGHILAGARPGGVLLVRVASDDEALLLRDGASRALMGTRTMSAQWFDVTARAIETDEDLLFWLDAARSEGD